MTRLGCLLLLLLGSGMVSRAQRTLINTRTVVSSGNAEFFERHPDVDSLSFSACTNRTRSLVVYERSGKNHYFDWGFIGDRYQAVLRFGPIRIADSSWLAANRPDALYRCIRGRLIAGELKLQLEEVVPDSSGDELFFLPLIPEIRLEADSGALVRNLEALVDKSSPASPRELVYLYRLLVERDGTVSEVQEILAANSQQSQRFQPVLKASGPWTPREAGGRKVRGRVGLYIRIRPDGHVDLEHQRYY